MKIQMRKFIIFIIIIILFCFNIEINVFSNELNNSYLNNLHIKEIDSFINNLEIDISGISFNNFIQNILKGNIDISFQSIISSISNIIFKEIHSVFSIFVSMFMIMILSSILKNITSSFCSRSVGEIGFYVCYMVMILSISDIFYTGANIAIETVNNMGNFLNITIPVFITISISTGNIGEGIFMAPFIAGISNFIINFISTLLIPCTITISTFDIINYISERELLKSLIEFFKKAISLMLKFTALFFASIISLHKLALPVFTGVLGKSAKAIVSSIPIIGDVMQSTIETGIAFMNSLKSGISLGVIIFIIIICSIPLIKLFLIFIIYKFAGIIAEPFCDKRLIGCMSCAADFTFIIMSSVITSTIIFIFSIIMLVSSNIL